MDWSGWVSDRWHWIAGPFGVTAWIGWLVRRRKPGLLRSLLTVWNANKRIAEIENERDAAIRSRDFLRSILAEMTDAAAMVEKARAAGLLTISQSSPSEPGTTPGSSGSSPSRPEPPIRIP